MLVTTLYYMIKDTLTGNWSCNIHLSSNPSCYFDKKTLIQLAGLVAVKSEVIGVQDELRVRSDFVKSSLTASNLWLQPDPSPHLRLI